MWVKDLYVDIPKRDNALETKLHIKIVSEAEDNLAKKPYIFMLPGGPGANHSHYKDYECLRTAGNVVFIDPRGCGLSDRQDPSLYTMQNYIQDVNEIRKYLNLDKIVLLGKSYGAMCALSYTLDYPQHVSNLILAAGSPSFKNIETARQNIEKRGTEIQQKACEQLWAGNFKSDEEVDKFFDILDSMYSKKKRNNMPVNRPAANLPFSYQPLNQGFGGFLWQFDVEARLPEVQCPTLILVGEEDWITDKKHSELMAAKIPNNELIVFPNADHSMESDVPEAYFSSIQSFLTKQCEKRNAHYFFPAKYEKIKTVWFRASINQFMESQLHYVECVQNYEGGIFYTTQYVAEALASNIRDNGTVVLLKYEIPEAEQEKISQLYYWAKQRKFTQHGIESNIFCGHGEVGPKDIISFDYYAGYCKYTHKTKTYEFYSCDPVEKKNWLNQVDTDPYMESSTPCQIL